MAVPLHAMQAIGCRYLQASYTETGCACVVAFDLAIWCCLYQLFKAPAHTAPCAHAQSVLLRQQTTQLFVDRTAQCM